MGADFTYALVDMSIDKPTLVQFVKDMDYRTLVSFHEQCYVFLSVSDEDIEDDNEWVTQVKDTLIGSIDAVFDSGSCREVGHLFVNKNHYLITGGMSWGDPPTDIYPDFDIVESLQNFYRSVNSANRA